MTKLKENMKQKFYKALSTLSLLVLALTSSISLNAQSQGQGLYADTVTYPNSNAITVNIRTTKFSNIIGFQGSINWDKTTLQYTSHAGNAVLGLSNYTFNATNAVSQGVLTYIYTDGATTHTVPDGTVAISINFNVINNPVSTYSNNTFNFSNTPTTLGIDTSDATFTDFGSFLFPAVQNHISGFVSFARPPVLTYTGGDIIDTITNRPVGCTYQWFESGNPVAGPNASTYPNAPTGNYTLKVTYPNGTIVTSVNAVLPVRLSKFSGKYIDNVNQLSWSTSVETNTNNFEIERSVNGRDFKNVGKQKATGNSSVSQNYSFNDVVANDATVSYYRLKINDNNGAFTYSNIIKIAKITTNAISLYPNPTRGFVNVSGNKIQQISIADITGKILMQKVVDNVNNITLNIANLAKGVYAINVKNELGQQSTKLIVE